MRTTDTMTISLPPAMVKELEKVRKAENRTRSELVREALRRYFEGRFPVVQPSTAELLALRRGRAAFRRGDYVSLDKMLHDLAPSSHRPGQKKSARASGKRSGSR
jgi:predicted transcriptional regulator